MTTVTLRGTYECGRWAGMREFIKNTAHVLGLECSVDCTKSWLTESGRYSVAGPENKVRKFASILNYAASEYNAR